MERCGTCKHWKSAEDWHETHRDLRICDLAAHLTYKFTEQHRKDKILFGVVDGSDYYAALHTADDFGCTAWEAK